MGERILKTFIHVGLSTLIILALIFGLTFLFEFLGASYNSALIMGTLIGCIIGEPILITLKDAKIWKRLLKNSQ